MSLKLSAGGPVNVSAGGASSSGELRGAKGSGKISVGLGFALEGRILIDSTFSKIDSELPGLSDIKVPIKGEAAFDPFLLEADETATVEAPIPETELPEIPLGSAPGSLKLTVVKGSVVSSSFHGGCLEVASGEASYMGELTTEGSLVLKGQIVVDLPAPLNQTVDLGEIKIPIPPMKQTLDLGKKPTSAGDAKTGAMCKGSSEPSGGGDPSSKGDPASKGEGETDKNGCTKRTCEAFGGACGDHADGCGGVINCGQCDGGCKPKSCDALGASCGTHPNGCGGVTNCGVCSASCPGDVQEPNDSFSQARDLGPATDNPNTSKTIAGLSTSDGDEDWFKMRVSDLGWGGNPSIKAVASDRLLEVALFYLCDNGPNYSYCGVAPAGLGPFSPAADALVRKGCQGPGGTILKTDCSGTDESGEAYLRVRQTASDGSCHAYTLDLTVE